jgi:sec-independent protein translocase protein TatA
MNRVGFTEFLLILAIVVVIFGANRLPELGRGIGRGIRSFKESLREGANDKS